MHPKESLFQPPCTKINCPSVLGCVLPMCSLLLSLMLLPVVGKAQISSFGATHNESSEVAQIIEFTLTDDDPADVFSIDIVRDLMFGTPVFRMNSKGSVNNVIGDNSNLNVYPNPTSDLLSMLLNDASVIDRYSLRDITGNVVRHDEFRIPVHVANFNMTEAPGGVYILQVHSGDRLFSREVIKQ